MGAKRILAVENNDLVLSFLEAGLMTAGYDVDTASNGREALEKIDRRAYDLIISDVDMPELDGLALYRALGERRSHDLRRFLLLTGSDAINDHRAFIAESGVRAVAKPVALDDLQVIVERMIREPETVSAGANRG
jgi:two-component system CheB/CheR fusion protein